MNTIIKEFGKCLGIGLAAGTGIAVYDEVKKPEPEEKIAINRIVGVATAVVLFLI